MAGSSFPEPRDAAGIYAHIPFCVVRCTYCDFYSQTGADGLMPSYMDALVEDITSFPRRTGYRPVIASIYLGGGTPSHTEAGRVVAVIAACRAAFPVAPDAEISLEANPESLTAEGIRIYAEAGVNRLSIGVQSLRDARLRVMGRPHDAAEALAAVDRARGAGFENVSADFIYGLPDQSAEEWREDLGRIVRLGLSHLSAYLLETDKQTPLARDMAAGRFPEPEAVTVSEQYETTCAILEGAGYRQYEVSSFARPGRECRHNIGYWTDRPYLGFGSSAHGYWGGRRTAVRLGAADYIASVRQGKETMETVEPPDPGRRLAEAIITGLRLTGGLDIGALSARYGPERLAAHAAVIEEELAAGRLESESGRLRLTRAGILHANDVLCRFV